MRSFILAHDLGTTGNKATLYNREGQLVGSAFFAYETDYPRTSWAEQNPEDWWQAICASTQKLLALTSIKRDDIACITFSGQMMGCVPLDKDARPLRTAIIWADQRAVTQEHWVGERVPPQEIYRITGHRLSASYSLQKILWLRDNQPEIYHAAHKFVHAKDAMVARMTGNFVTDVSDASGMNLYDLEAGCWSARILAAVGLEESQLPEVHPSIDVVGEVLPTVADEIGVAPGTPVVIGGGDGPCAAAGSGVVAEGSAYNYIGSSSWIAVASRSPVLDPECKTVTFEHIVPGMFTPNGTMQAAGASYQWMRDQLCGVEVDLARESEGSPYEQMNAAAASSPPGANGLIFLPHLMGERSPRWNPKARGAFIGLTIRHTRADMIRAVLEGVTMNLRLILAGLQSHGVQVEAMRLIGGGARGRFWNQMMANIYGLPVYRMAILEEATSMGAAMAGGVGVGLFPDFSVSQQMNPVAEIFTPNPAAQRVYAQIYPLFEACYQALEPVYEQINNLR
jgi:xylulokinase